MHGGAILSETGWRFYLWILFHSYTLTLLRVRDGKRWSLMCLHNSLTKAVLFRKSFTITPSSLNGDQTNTERLLTDFILLYNLFLLDSLFLSLFFFRSRVIENRWDVLFVASVEKKVNRKNKLWSRCWRPSDRCKFWKPLSGVGFWKPLHNLLLKFLKLWLFRFTNSRT